MEKYQSKPKRFQPLKAEKEESETHHNSFQHSFKKQDSQCSQIKSIGTPSFRKQQKQQKKTRFMTVASKVVRGLKFDDKNDKTKQHQGQSFVRMEDFCNCIDVERESQSYKSNQLPQRQNLLNYLSRKQPTKESLTPVNSLTNLLKE